MNIWSSLAAVVLLVAIAFAGVEFAGMEYFFGVVVPYTAIGLFFAGFVYRILKWARAPVPFKIPSTCGQQKSLPWIKHNTLESPFTTWQVIKRMALEILFFRSLFRNTKQTLYDNGKRIIYTPNKWLWLFSLAFHWSFLIIFIRHMRFFTEPVPGVINILHELDSLFQVFVPIIYLTDVIIVAALTWLFVRRVVIPQIKYISLASDYFPLFLILGIALSGILVRYFFKVDIVNVKELAMGLVSFAPGVPAKIGSVFYIHFFLVCILFAYFPFSKLMHLGGVFLSPTRNLPNNNRAERHINPWNPTVKLHSYEEYEDEFREKMKAIDLPLDKE